MKFQLFIISIFAQLVMACGSDDQQNNNSTTSSDADYLVKIFDGDDDYIGQQTGYATPDGEIVIPIGKYYYCYTDKFETYAIVMDENATCYAIDRNENVLYNIFWYDNGPDYVSEGLFRIVVEGKIGYADATTGEIVIEPQFSCAYPFEDGVAEVTYDCTSEQMDEHKIWNSNDWFFIDKQGNIVED
ncbi:MAG: WG repeat-containing protein [Bacteroidales bacterium]|nr:WG repeat-containing protein [Bacteroidales bacterium]